MKYLHFIALLLTIHGNAISQNNSPEWTKDLIIYEISIKNFTSPNGFGSGTFNSTKQKVPYLNDLGVNAIWLSGHNWSNEKHFYGIWTQYACIQPDSIDPSLGTRNEMKLLIDECHKYGIKVFLDIITHGVMNESPLIEQHPEWFKGGSWGMTDYDWQTHHKDLDDWWVKTHVDYALNQGVDGFRLDVAIYRLDLWQRIKNECASKGKSIVVFPEHKCPADNTVDFFQRFVTISNQTLGVDSTVFLISNVGRYFSNLKPDKIQNTSISFPGTVFLSTQLSSHDDGWEGFPANNNPFVAEGSRCLFGYSFLFVPGIPIFMSGEEFNAGFIGHPNLTSDLFGKHTNENAKWLYGAVLDWNQIKKPPHSSMLSDIKRMIQIRKTENDIFHASIIDSLPVVQELDYGADQQIPVPYALQNDEKIIIVAGNPTNQKVECVLKLILNEFDLEITKEYVLYDLWNNKKRTIKGKDLEHFKFTILPDKMAKGGLSIFKIIKKKT